MTGRGGVRLRVARRRCRLQWSCFPSRGAIFSHVHILVVEFVEYVAWERQTDLTRALGPVVHWSVVEARTSHASVVVIDLLV